MVEIVITIPDSKLDDLKAGFLKGVPKPPELIHLSDMQFFKRWLKDMVFHAYRNGKMKIAQEAISADIDEDVVESVD